MTEPTEPTEPNIRPRPGPDRGRPVEPESPVHHRATSAVLVVNPRDGRGRVGRELAAIERDLGRRSIEHRVAIVQRSGEGTLLARRALEEGERFVVAVGGDGTVNEVLNGMLEGDRPVAPDAVLGILAAHSGCDAVRTFGLAQDPVVALDRLSDGQVYRVDVGRVTATSRDGERTRYFLNMAQAGLGGLAATRAARLPRLLRGSGSFWGYWWAMGTFRRPRIHMRGDRREFEGPVTNVVVANLQFAGNGMLVSPRSWPEDGYFDLQVYTGPKSDSFTLLPKMFVGEHLPNPNILEYRSSKVRIEADRPVAVEADGLPVGWAPATLEVVPRVLRLKI